MQIYIFSVRTDRHSDETDQVYAAPPGQAALRMDHAVRFAIINFRVPTINPARV